MWRPRKEKFEVSLPVFDGGLNTRFTKSRVPLNQSTDLQNVQFDDYGSVQTINGFKTYNTGSYFAGFGVDGLVGFRNASLNSWLLAVCGEEVIKVGVSSNTVITESTGIFTSQVNVSTCIYKNHVWFTNGYAIPHKWNGTTFSRAGNTAPTAWAVTLASSGAGLLSGTYYYKFSYVNSAGAESELSPLTGPFDVASKDIKISAIPTAPASFNVSTINIYRTTALTAANYWYITAVTNGTTFVTDIAADTTLDTESSAEGDNYGMPLVKYLIEYRSYMYGAGDPSHPSRLYWSARGEPERWPADKYVDVGEDDGTIISGISAFSNSIIIHKTDGSGNGSIYILHVPDSLDVADESNWYLLKSPATYSAESHRSIVPFSNRFLFINRYGFYAFNGQDISASAAESNIGKFLVDSHSAEIEPDISTISVTDLPNVAGINYDNKLWFATGIDSSGCPDSDERIYIYDFVRTSNSDRTIGAWSRTGTLSKPINCFTTLDGVLYGGSMNDGEVYQMNTGYNFCGSAIESYFVTAGISGAPEHRDNEKVWRFLYLNIDAVGAWKIKVYYILDFNDETGVPVDVDLTPEGITWNNFKWGESLWGGGKTRKWVEIGLGQSVSRTIQFKFYSNTADQYWKVNEAKVLYNLRGTRGSVT